MARSPSTVRDLLALSATEWRPLAVGSVFLLLGSGMGLLYPQAIRLIIDGVLGAGDRAAVDRAAVAMLVIFAVQGIAIAVRHVLFATTGERIVTRLRHRLYGHLVRQEIGFFDERRTGELLSRLSNDASLIQGAVSQNISMILRSLAGALGGVGFLMATSVRLTGLMLLVVPPVAIGAVFYGRRIRRLARKAQDALAGAGEIAEETLAGIRSVRAYTRERSETERYAAAVEASFELARQRIRISAVFQGTASFAGYASVAVVLWYGGRLVLTGDLSVGDLASFILYTLIVAMSVATLGGLWSSLMSAAGAADRVFELLRRQALLPIEGGATPEALVGRVAFEGVSFAYPARPDVVVLDDVSFAIEPGDVVALVGPSGGGKSTIAALIQRFYDPTAGRVTLDGRDLVDLDPTWLRRRIAMVRQDPVLLSTSIEENIGYGREGAAPDEIVEAARAANADDFVRAFPDAYRTLVGERGVQLSGGQRQRVAIARAVLKDAPILILDEATSALDAESEHLVRDAVGRLMSGRTTLVIAHRLSTVKDADRVLVVDGGRIVEAGTHQELLAADGLYRKLVERQFEAA